MIDETCFYPLSPDIRALSPGIDNPFIASDAWVVMRVIFVTVLLFLAACATTPPVQEMAAARSAISTAKSLPDGGSEAAASLKSAEQALEEAARSIENEGYGQARRLAIKARQRAQRAARLKQSGR